MSGFNDLLGIDTEAVSPLEGHTFRRAIGAQWMLPIAVLIDDAGKSVNLSAGFTAVAQFRTRQAGLLVAEFTSAGAGGLAVDLSDPDGIALVATVLGSFAFADFADHTLTFDLIVRRVSDGASLPVAVDCYFIPLAQII